MSQSKESALDYLIAILGAPRKLGNGQSLFSFAEGAVRIYFRYSKVHTGDRTFYGLRESDLRMLEGHNGFICFLDDSQKAPVVIPFSDFEDVFHSTTPAEDGQFKVQIIESPSARVMYIARAGRFIVDGFTGLEQVLDSIRDLKYSQVPPLSHSQVQTMLASIGHMKGYDVYVPTADCGRLDWTIPNSEFPILDRLPGKFDRVMTVLAEIDVVWARRGAQEIVNLFEVEHSTPVYSGLLRFNDVLLTDRTLDRFSIVSNDSRRGLFVRQVNRPTFVASGLVERASFLEYPNVYNWHGRMQTMAKDTG